MDGTEMARRMFGIGDREKHERNVAPVLGEQHGPFTVHSSTGCRISRTLDVGFNVIMKITRMGWSKRRAEAAELESRIL